MSLSVIIAAGIFYKKRRTDD
ncbi:MAG: hypothetical protein ACOC53_01680 [Candidatus Saliniplasma sp.]